MSMIDMGAALPQQGIGGLAPAKTEDDYPTRMRDILPGSQIRVGGPRVGGPPFTAIVLQTYPEWGATGEPALYVKADTLEDPIVISEAAGYEVTVTANAREFITDALPPGAIAVQVKPTRGTAIQFKGGIENATEIVRWALGRGAPRYDRGTDTEPETMTFGGLGATGGVAQVGDWIVLLEDGTFHIHSTLDAYDEEL